MFLLIEEASGIQKVEWWDLDNAANFQEQQARTQELLAHAHAQTVAPQVLFRVSYCTCKNMQLPEPPLDPFTRI